MVEKLALEEARFLHGCLEMGFVYSGGSCEVVKMKLAPAELFKGHLTLFFIKNGKILRQFRLDKVLGFLVTVVLEVLWDACLKK